MHKNSETCKCVDCRNGRARGELLSTADRNRVQKIADILGDRWFEDLCEGLDNGEFEKLSHLQPGALARALTEELEAIIRSNCFDSTSSRPSRRGGGSGARIEISL